MDLVGRKLAANGGRGMRLFLAIVAGEIAEAKQGPQADFAARLEKATGELQAATLWLMQNAMAAPDNAGAAAYSYMHLTGIVTLGLMWLRMIRAAQAAIDEGEGDRSFMEAKLVTARFFAERIMPDAGALRRKIEGGSEALMALPADAF
jgi:hypothetical protein